MTIAIICCKSSKIKDVYEAEKPDHNIYGGPFGDPDKYVHVEIPAKLMYPFITVIKDLHGQYILSESAIDKKARIEFESK